MKKIQSGEFNAYKLDDGRAYITKVCNDTTLPVHNPAVGKWLIGKGMDLCCAIEAAWYYCRTGKYGEWRIMDADGHALSTMLRHDVSIPLDDNGNEIKTKIEDKIEDVIKFENIYKVGKNKYLIYTCGARASYYIYNKIREEYGIEK